MGMGNIAITGMQAAMSDMEIISNNISNANTVGYKKSSANFSDIFPSGTNASSSQIGLGVSLSNIQQDFKPGGPIQTQLPTNLSIADNGFFILKDSSTGQIKYSRAGQFTFDQVDGTFKVGNQHLQGFPALNNTIPAGSSPVDIKVNTTPIAAKATTTVTAQALNLGASDTVPTVTPFDPNNPQSYNFTSIGTVYDSLGYPNTLTMYYVKTSTANTWTAKAVIGGTVIGTGTLTFGTDGKLSSATGLNALQFSPTSGAVSPQTFAVDMTNSTQFGSPDSASQFTFDGYPAGTFQTAVIDKDGKVNAHYSNGQNVLVGQVALAIFSSPEGLQNLGGASWAETSASGKAMVDPSNSTSNVLQGYLESSNVDLATEMVNLINAQNTFQANAQVEQVYNQVMQTVTKL